MGENTFALKGRSGTQQGEKKEGGERGKGLVVVWPKGVAVEEEKDTRTLVSSRD